MAAVCAPDIRFPSLAVACLVFVGRTDVTALFTHVCSILLDVTWNEPVGHDRTWVVVGEAGIGRLRVWDAVAVTINDQGQISEIVSHLGSCSATTVLLARLVPRILTFNPAILRRTLLAART